SRQDNVVRLYPRQLVQDGARRVSEAGALLPHLKGFPQHEREKANQDMGLNAVLSLVPDRPHVQLALLDPKGGFRLSELNIGLPQLLIAPVGDIRSQQIGTLGEFSPEVERGVGGDAEAETGGAGIRLQRDGEAGGGPLVALERAADLPVHYR